MAQPTTPSRLLNRFFGSAISTAAGFAVGSVITPTLRPLVQDLINTTWAAHPVRPLSADEAATAVIRDLMTPGAAATEASYTGIDGERFNIMRGLAGEPPGSQQILELWNRGAIEQDMVDLGLRQSRMRPEWYAPYKTLRNVLVPVSDLIRMAVREVFSDSRTQLQLDAEYPTALTAKARLLGLSEESARDYWAAHWNLPSREEGADMWHRGLLSDDAYDGLLKALDYSPTWRDNLKQISNAIPTLSDMIRFAVREVYAPQAERDRLGIDLDYPTAFTAQAKLHGLTEEYARAYWAAHWRLPSAQQGYQMLWRDELDQDGLRELLKALDYPLPWRERLQNIAYHPLGRVDLRRLLAAGILDRGAVKKGYQHLGYTEANAEILTQFAEQQAAGSTTAQPWANRARSRVFTAAWSDFLDGNSDTTAFHTMLEAIDVPTAEIDTVVRLATVERDNVRRDLTQAQILKLYKKAVWPQDKTHAALVDLGMSDQDATDLMGTA